ncbi:hypothetical protein PFLUV_G00089190 [Perca fluviatilis]|uniref:Uncharacterized protein n=1 Tax=Perca fluviatilis TaxID=8168 RepID=A0A6A5EGH9_PERFL|nr:hypothetical protein PFLUV_G00089190 [Perca fluviatilis]
MSHHHSACQLLLNVKGSKLELEMDSSKRAPVMERKNELHHMMDDVRRWFKDSHQSVCGAGHVTDQFGP